MQFKALFCVVILASILNRSNCYSVGNPYAFYMFENFPGCEKALKYEVELLKNLRKLRETLVEHRNRLQELNTRSKSTDGFLDYNKTFSQFTERFKTVNASLKLENSTILPKKDDYEGALKGIVFLHDTYDFFVPKMLEGQLMYIDHNRQWKSHQSIEKMTIKDLVEFTKFAQASKNYDRAITFMRTVYESQNKKQRKKHEKWRKILAVTNNELFAENRTAIKDDFKTLPYFVNANMEPMEIQPKWIRTRNFTNLGYTGGRKNTDYFSRKVCHEGYFIRKKENIPWTKCVLYHHNNPYLKLGPFTVEVVSEKPHRVVYHKLFSENEIKWMLDYSRPRLSSLRQTELDDPQAKRLQESKNGTRRVVYKTIQTWFRETEYFPNGTQLVYSNLLVNMTKKIALATQFVINRKTSATDYQTTNYGLGGLCETHRDPYGYLEGAALHDDPDILDLINTGDMLGTVMGWLSDVQAGGGTAFSYPYEEQLVQPTRGSAAFWYSLDRKGHIMKPSLHAGCPVLIGQKWILNRWVFYFDQWQKFPCGLDPEERFESPQGYYRNNK